MTAVDRQVRVSDCERRKRAYPSFQLVLSTQLRERNKLWAFDKHMTTLLGWRLFILESLADRPIPSFEVVLIGSARNAVASMRCTRDGCHYRRRSSMLGCYIDISFGATVLESNRVNFAASIPSGLSRR